MELIDIAGIVITLGLYVLLLYHQATRAPSREYRDLLTAVDEQFRQLVVENPKPELCFNGGWAQIVDETAEYDADERSTLPRIHRYARNEHGEYFYFISDGAGKPFFKHIPHKIAKIVLKEKYREPNDASL